MQRLGITWVLILVSSCGLFAQVPAGGDAATEAVQTSLTGPSGMQPSAAAPAQAFRLPEPVVQVRVADAHREQEPTGPGVAPTLTAERETTPEGLAIPQLPSPDTADGAARESGEPVAAAYTYQHRRDAWLDPGATGPRRAAPPAVEVPVEPEPEPGPEPPATEPEELVLVWPEAARNAGGIVARRQVIAYYGHPFSRFMGILGESPIQEMAADLVARAAEYDKLNGEIGVAPAFHIIYGTVYEDATIGILRESKLLEYIQFAEENDIIVFLDHQIGRYTVREAIQAMLPYLAYEHVHLAIDPEWATTQPGQVIGGVRAEEINMAQQMMSDYMRQNGIAGPKMLVVHQFNWRMITDRERVRTDYDGVQLIHNADGFGRPAEKYVSWEFNVRAANMPLKGFKLFYPKSWRDGGYDDPLLTPREVLQLQPVPVYIQYQ